MPVTDPRIDAYIHAARSFAQPLLTHLRDTVQRVCPEVQETMKWSFPHFMYAGEILCSMAAFKEHVAFGFWKAASMQDSERLLNPIGDTAMGHFGRIRSLQDLPEPETLERYLREAMRLNEEGVKVRHSRPRQTRVPQEVPPDFAGALKQSPEAHRFFSTLSHSQQAEYINWILEAKTSATREKRIATSVEWLSEGKRRNWKYKR